MIKMDQMENNAPEGYVKSIVTSAIFIDDILTNYLYKVSKVIFIIFVFLFISPIRIVSMF